MSSSTESETSKGHDTPDCCAPTKRRLAQLNISPSRPAERVRATRGSIENMVKLEGTFWMGSQSPAAFSGDGEGPIRRIHLGPFYI